MHAVSAEQGQVQTEGDGLQLFAVKMAYEDDLLVSAPSEQLAALAAYVHRGHHRKFTSEEKAAYLNVYSEGGAPLLTHRIRDWLAKGEAYLRALHEHCLGSAKKRGLEEGSEEWEQHISSIKQQHVAALGLVA